LTLRNDSLFTRSFLLIPSIFLQHCISNLSRHLWHTWRNVQVSAPYKVMFEK